MEQILLNTILDDIKKRTFHRAYLLYGTEDYLKQQYKNRLLKALVPDDNSMNFTRYEGKAPDENAIISQADTMPFFAERRVILIEGSGYFKNKADDLADYMKKLPDYLVMIFSEDEVDKRSRMYKAVQKVGCVTEFAEQTEETLTRWVAGRMGREGKKIRRSTMQHFLEVTGTDMANISNELEKLLCYDMGKEEITIEDIDAICAPQITDRIFEMIRAVTEHQQRKAMDLYADLLALKVPPMRTLYLLARQYNQFLQIKTLAADGLSSREIAGKMGVRPFVVTKSMGICRRYSVASLQAILEDCVSTEEQVKTGHLDDELSVEMLIIKYS